MTPPVCLLLLALSEPGVWYPLVATGAVWGRSFSSVSGSPLAWISGWFSPLQQVTARARSCAQISPGYGIGPQLGMGAQ